LIFFSPIRGYIKFKKPGKIYDDFKIT